MCLLGFPAVMSLGCLPRRGAIGMRSSRLVNLRAAAGG